jgi:hypothetical protein
MGAPPCSVRKTAARDQSPVDEITEVRVLDPYFYAQSADQSEMIFDHTKLIKYLHRLSTATPAGSAAIRS